MITPTFGHQFERILESPNLQDKRIESQELQLRIFLGESQNQREKK
jgi:hypothetical protein